MKRTAILLTLLLPLAIHAQVDRAAMQPVERAALDVELLDPLARSVLDAPEFKWRHAQTEHFVVHFENGIFAAKVARQAEFFHQFIGQDLPGLANRQTARSHIFIFRNPRDWEVFIKRYHKGELEWAFSMVTGYVMYLQQAGDIASSAEVLGHEMTHLVMNRFLTGRLPLWLNEGLAEWYGEFAYAAFKGVKKSKRTQFQGLRSTYPVKDLLASEAYPADRKTIHAFYQTSKHLVAYLQLEQPPGTFTPFLLALAGGAEIETALNDHYQLDLETLGERFNRFRR